MPGNISGINGRFIKPVLTRKEKKRGMKMKKLEVIRALEFLNSKTVDKFNRLFWVSGANITGLKESIQVPGTPSNVTGAGFDIVEALKIKNSWKARK